MGDMLFSAITEPLEDAPGRKVVRIDSTIGRKKELFDTFGRQVFIDPILASQNSIAPGSQYFGRNFDAFDDCLTSLRTIEAVDFYIAHSSLPSLTRPNLLIYLHILYLHARNSNSHRISPILEEVKMPNLYCHFKGGILTSRIVRAVLELDLRMREGPFDE